MHNLFLQTSFYHLFNVIFLSYPHFQLFLLCLVFLYAFPIFLSLSSSYTLLSSTTEPSPYTPAHPCAQFLPSLISSIVASSSAPNDSLPAIDSFPESSGPLSALAWRMRLHTISGHIRSHPRTWFLLLPLDVLMSGGSG